MRRNWIAGILATAMLSSTMPAVQAEEPAIVGSISGETFAQTSTAEAAERSETSSPASNAADFTSVMVTADAGETLVYENLDFTGAKVLMMEAAIPDGSTSKNIKLYVDQVTAENEIGTLTTRAAAKVNDLDFNEQYATLTKAVEGAHDLILQFETDTSLELDFLKLTSYTGSETEAERDARMAWWRDAKFGQFIHMGAYSYLGGWYNGQKSGFYSEWIMSSMGIPKEEYAQNAAAKFNPKDFNAAKIVADAKAAGQKYIVITSRHHEGFSIFDTQIRNFRDYSLFSYAEQSGYNGVDPLKALSEECREQGIHFGVYITIMDWHDPSQIAGGGIAEGYTKEEYKAQLKGQVKELIEEYGAEVFFFDGEWVGWWTKEDGQEVYRYMLSLDEDCIVNNRVGKRHQDDGDYGTPEQEIPATGLDYDWESCMTMNDNWGYCIGDTNWKSTQWIVENVLDIASKGGNLLLNVGPDGNGVVEQAPIDNMAAAGKWLQQFGEAVYGTSASCFESGVPGNVRITTKEGKVYVSLLAADPVSVGTITIPALQNEILGVKALADDMPIPYVSVGGKLQLNVAATEKQEYATVYEITVDGNPTAVEGAEDSRTNLAATAAVTASTAYSDQYGANLLVDGKTDASSGRWAPTDDDAAPAVTLNLGATKTIREIVLYEWLDTFFTQEYRCGSFQISVSTNGTEWKPVHSGTTVGERLSVVLDEPIDAQYIKIHNIVPVASAGGNPSFHEVQIYGELPPEITIASTKQLVDTLPLHLEGTCSGGSTVNVQVWSAAFPAFTVQAAVDEESGTWSADITKEGMQASELTLTAILQSEDGAALAMESFHVEYSGRENLAFGDGVSITQSSAYDDVRYDYTAATTADGILNDGFKRWAPADEDENPYMTVNLGSRQDIGEIVLYEWWDTYFDHNYRCQSFKISVSDNGNDWKEVHTGTTIGKQLSVVLQQPVTAQYIKIHDIQGSESGNVSLHEVAVYAPANVSVTGVTLNQSSAQLEVGDSVPLTAAVAPDNATDKAVTWSSSDSTVAAVEDGVVTGLKAGTAKITVTTADGNHQATCVVTVAEQDDGGSTVGGGSSVTASYTITVTQADGGKISPSTTSVTKGSDKTFTITANEGYQIADVLVDGKSVGAVSSYTFQNVTAKHTITARFEKDEAGTTDHFTDVRSGDWFHDAVAYVVENGLMNGVAPDQFAPRKETTRGMVVTILYREAGAPAVESDGKTWWSDARVWAMEAGITDGTNMDDTLTREQLAAMLYRYVGSPAVSGAITGFSDAAEISDWASDAMLWAVQNGIITGSGSNLEPQGDATRAEVAAMLMRFGELTK